MDIATEENSGWTILWNVPYKHVVPVDEVEQHSPENCKCMPTFDADDPGVCVHHSYDNREAFERGERKPS